MAGKKFVRVIAGVLTEVLGIQTSAGAANAGDIPALDANGQLDITLMPSGVGAQTKTVTASEALAAGDWVNVYDIAGTAGVRKADATTAGKEANGFVLASVLSAGSGTVYLSGTNNQLTGQTIGRIFLATTAGAGSSSAPSAAGNIVQELGTAISATEVSFRPKSTITLA